MAGLRAGCLVSPALLRDDGKWPAALWAAGKLIGDSRLQVGVERCDLFDKGGIAHVQVFNFDEREFYCLCEFGQFVGVFATLGDRILCDYLRSIVTVTCLTADGMYRLVVTAPTISGNVVVARVWRTSSARSSVKGTLPRFQSFLRSTILPSGPL